MIEHLTPDQVNQFNKGQLSRGDILDVLTHVSDCESCSRMIAAKLDSDDAFFSIKSQAILGTDAAVLDAGTGTHLTAQQTAEYVDGRLDGEEFQVADDHVTSCEACAMALADLRAFKKGLEIEPPDYAVRNDAALPHVRTPERSNAAWWATIFRPAAVAVLAGLFLIAFTVFLIWRSHGKREASQEQVAAPSPEAPAASIVAQLVDGGGSVTLYGDGKVSGDDRLPTAYQELIKQALANQTIGVSPLVKGLNRAPGTLLGADKGAERFSVNDPVGKLVLTDRPTFRWSALDGATTYVVEVYDENYSLVESSSDLTDHLWISTRPLQRGRLYSWQVKAMKDGQAIKSPRPPAPEAKFRVVDAATAAELSLAHRDYATSHLTLGLLYAKAGLIEDAQKEFQELQKANPNSEIVQKLLSELQMSRH